MKRLTIKTDKKYITDDTKCMNNKYITKLGQLEDLMEKYEINSIEALEELIKESNKLKSKLTRWLELLETDGIDSKNMVATDIQCLLKQLNDDTIKQSEGGKQ